VKHEVCILFAHHRNDQVTQYHYSLIRRYNPTVPIVPLTYGFKSVLPGNVDVAEFKSRWEIGEGHQSIWRNLDAWLYVWFEECHNVEAERYIFLEWDCYCNCSVFDFYKDVSEADLAAASIRTNHEDPDDWYWWVEKEKLGIFQSAARGIVPLAGLLISERLLDWIKHTSTWHVEYQLQGVFSELRLGTLANILGARLIEIPGAKDVFLTAHQLHKDPCDGPGIYHQIKYVRR